MPNFLIALAFLLPTWLHADELKLKETAPDRHVVVKGDTLWEISARFLEDPWRWPEIWQLNREQINNPHLIYPGDVILVVQDAGGPRLELVRGEVLKLSPTTRAEPISDTPISSIPQSAIMPFLEQPKVVEPEGLKGTARIIAVPNERVMLGANDAAYATPGQAGVTDWHIFRPGKGLLDPVNGELLGYEVEYVGEAKTTKPGAPQTLLITRTNQEVLTGDRLLPVEQRDARFSYVPRAPQQPVDGVVISAYGRVADAGRYATILVNRGRREGLEEGDVLALYRAGPVIHVPVCPNHANSKTFETLNVGQLAYKEDCPDRKAGEIMKLPDVRHGLVFVYRVFDRVAYALVVQSEGPVTPGDIVRNP
jgi:LysM domain